MARKRPASVIHRPLGAILGSQGKVAVLRELWRSPVGLSCQELARRCELAYRTVDLTLKDLLAHGALVHAGGVHERLYRLRAGHRLIPPLEALFRAESDCFPAMRSELVALARSGGPGLLSVSIVGSVAAGGELIGDDVHLVAVVDEAVGVRRWTDRFVAGGNGLLDRYGVRLKVTVYDLKTAVRMWATRTSAAEAAVRSADLVEGQPLDALLDGQA